MEEVRSESIMDKKHIDVLKQMRQNIIDDLDVYNGIIVPLTSEYILKQEDVIDIKKGKTKEERAKILLDLLPDRGAHAFEVFHQSLKSQYWWLSDDIDKILESIPSGIADNDISAYHNMHTYHNLQPVSPLTVTREEMIMKLKNALNIVQPNGYIVLHGMKGYGKSSLTTSTLKDKDLIFKLFNNEIYWIKFGCKNSISKEEILIQLNNLYHQIKNYNPLLDSANFEPFDKALKQSIENYFKKFPHKNALLILDDVCQKEIVDNFDFECKTLVITSDLGVVNKRNHIFLQMDNGFTESETLGLFAKVLDTNIEQLPAEAKLIHEECKGMPLLIAMFAAQFENFKHDMKDNKGRWEYYLNSLRTKNAKNVVMQEFLKIQEATFNVCIEQLNDEMKERYEHLVIFSEDVNIMPKTLEILWEDEPYSVDDQMLDFCHKSLAAKKWNDDLRSYVYGVHVLLLSHLKEKLSPFELRDQHRLFIQKLKKFCNGDFSKLPNDNYSFSYIGHHLEQAEKFEEFSSLYTNFDFLQAKINYTGLSDLFIDLKKYRDYITNKETIIESNIVDLEKFLETHTNTLAKHRLMKCLDLVQIALDYRKEGFVKETAKRLALSRSFSLYLDHQRNDIMTNQYLNVCEEVITNASTVVFTNDANHLLVGSHDGQIILWDCENRKSKYFRGHDKKYAIKKIILSHFGDYFLALSEDGTLKLFALSESEDIENGFNIPIQSPRQKQSFWTDLFETKHDDSLKTISIVNEHISDMKFAEENNKIAICTSSGTVAVFEDNGNLQWQDKYKDLRFGGVSFSTKDNLLHVMDELNSLITSYKKTSNNSYIYVSQYNLQLRNCKVVYFCKHPLEENCLVIVTDKTTVYVKWFYGEKGHIYNYEKIIKTEEKDSNTVYVAATLTYDARFLIIADSKGVICVMKAFNPDDIITYFKGKITSLDSYCCEYFHLICGSEKRLIHRWKVSADEKPKSVKKLIFDAKMENFGSENIVILKTSPTTITICKGTSTINKIESHHGRIMSMHLYDDAKNIIYITESGSVVRYNMITEKSIQISKLDSVDSFMDILKINNNYLVLCREENKLKVWMTMKVSHKIEGSDKVISVHKIKENYLLTVSEDGKIKYWNIEDANWQELYEFTDNDGTIISSCLSVKCFLAVLKSEQKVIIYTISNLDVESLNNLKMEFYLRHDYKGDLCFCKFSQDEKYLAVALEGGDISIIDVHGQLELGRLSLHCSTVNQIHWSPTSISAPILLSVNCDEMAWWNVSFLKTLNKNQNRRSRMGFNRSTSSPNVGMSPRSSCKLPNSQSADMAISKDVMKPSFNFDDYWSHKLTKSTDADRPALLGCIQLPSTCTGQINVCVSDDFSKFLTVDIHGMVSNYTLFGNFLL